MVSGEHLVIFMTVILIKNIFNHARKSVKRLFKLFVFVRLTSQGAQKCSSICLDTGNLKKIKFKKITMLIKKKVIEWSMDDLLFWCPDRHPIIE